MSPHQIGDSLSKQLPGLEEWPLSSDKSHEGRVAGHAPEELQEDPHEDEYLHSRLSTPHIDTAEIDRVLSPDPCPGSDTRARRGSPSVAHSLVSPSISESGDGEDPGSVRPKNLKTVN
jgi:hypothetical protein